MFYYLSQALSRFRSAPIQKLALAALLVVVAAVLLGSFARWLRRRRQDRPESWTGLLVDSLGSLLKVLVGLAALAAICLHLRFSAGEFTRLRGGVSQRNYDAVKTIWGRPHIQHELNAYLAYYTTHFYDKDGMELDPSKLKATTQPVGFRKEEVEHTVPGNPVTETDHDVNVWMNYRRKGLAWYPCFETNCRFKYRVVNFSGREVKAVFDFPLPAEQGLIDKLTVLIDGKPAGARAAATRAAPAAEERAATSPAHEPVVQPPPCRIVATGSKLTWGLPMAAGKAYEIVISYHSRGMDYLKFNPGAGRELRKYRLKMRCRGIRRQDLNYPIGCMTPTLIKSAGEDTLLEWTLDSAFTRLGMGLIVPKKQQAGYYIGRILAAAPWGLILLLTMVLVTRLATGRGVRWVTLTVLALGHHLHYLLTGHLADSVGLGGALAISAAALTGLMALMEFAFSDRPVAAGTVAFFALFATAYPLLRITSCHGLLMTILYVLLLGYVVVLLVRRRARRE